MAVSSAHHKETQLSQREHCHSRVYLHTWKESKVELSNVANVSLAGAGVVLIQSLVTGLTFHYWPHAASVILFNHKSNHLSLRLGSVLQDPAWYGPPTSQTSAPLLCSLCSSHIDLLVLSWICRERSHFGALTRVALSAWKSHLPSISMAQDFTSFGSLFPGYLDQRGTHGPS